MMTRSLHMRSLFPLRTALVIAGVVFVFAPGDAQNIDPSPLGAFAFADSSGMNILALSPITAPEEVRVLLAAQGRRFSVQYVAVIEVRANGILLARVVARSTDINGNGATGLADLELFRVNFFRNPDAQETDYDLSGSTDLGDLDIFRKEFFSGASGTLCN